MFVSVAICTWNRAKLLDQTLTQMRKLRIPEGLEWELLVVNNNCTDKTDEVLSSHSTALPLRRYLEPKQGHSNARNCAIAHAGGDLLLWTDDDVLVSDNWLTEYLEAARTYPDAAFFGGPVRPWWETPPPKWIQRHLKTLGGLWALLDLGGEVRPLTSQENVHGANMAFRIDVLRQHRFDPSLGHIGYFMQGNDENTLMEELRRSGRWGVWIGTAPVQHFITRSRMTCRFLWNILQAHARHLPKAKEDYRNYPTLLGHPRWLLRQYWTACLKALLRSPLRDERWMQSFVEAAELGGILRELQTKGGHAMPQDICSSVDL